MTNRLYSNEPVASSATTPTMPTHEDTTQPDAQRPAAFAEGTAPSPKLAPEPSGENEMLARGSQARLMSPSAKPTAMSQPATPSVKPTMPATKPATAAAPAKLAEGTAPEAAAYRVPMELATKATQIGEVWSAEYVRELRAQHRDIIGGWPGTLREARRRVLAAMPRNLDPLHLEELAKITNLAARKGWESISEPDLEP